MTSTASEAKVCTVYRDELSRRLTQYAPTSVMSAPDTGGLSSTCSVPVAPSSGSSSTSNPFRGTDLPSFIKGMVCSTFIQSLESQLLVNNVPKDKWSLAFLKVVTDSASNQWIRTHIHDPALPWADACIAFTAHFESADSAISMTNEWNNMMQRPHESVQLYGDRFIDLMNRRGWLGKPDMNEFAISHFTSHLNGPMYKAYTNAKAMQRIMGTLSSKPATLAEEIQVAINLDVTRLAINSANNSGSTEKTTSVGSNSGHRSGHSHSKSHGHHRGQSHASGKKKYCVYHPGSHTHNTAECSHHRKATAGGGGGTPSAGPQSTSSSAGHRSGKPSGGNTDGRPPPTCFGCGQVGHIKPQCTNLPKLESASGRSGSGSGTTSTNTTKPIVKQEGTRHSARLDTKTPVNYSMARGVHVNASDDDEDMYYDHIDSKEDHMHHRSVVIDELHTIKPMLDPI